MELPELKWLYELVDKIKLIEWASALAFVTVLWKLVLKSAFEIWWKNKLDQQKEEIGNTLAIQKEIILKNAAFQRVKLERVLPLLEEINSAIIEHNLMFNDYIRAIANNISYPIEMEEMRLEQDKKIVSSISKISIYIPPEFRILLYQIRKVISCSWCDTEIMYRVIESCGSSAEIVDATQILYVELIDCYYSMCQEYISHPPNKKDFIEILKLHRLDQDSVTTRSEPPNQLAWKFVLLPDYHGSNDKIIAQTEYERHYKAQDRRLGKL